MDFSDRFTYSNPTFATLDLSQASESQMLALSEPLQRAVTMVRRSSVVLKNQPVKEIYYAITQHADPRIALILAAAKDKNSTIIFPTLTDVKAVMFGPPEPGSSVFSNPYSNLFVQGVLRVSCALAASVLIGQLSQIPEQATHGNQLEQQALADLDRILDFPDISSIAEVSKTETQATAPQTFYFQNTTVNLSSSTIQGQVFISSGATSSWQTFGTYSQEVAVSRLVSDLADAINQQTLISQTSNLLAAPVLASGKSADKDLHRIEIQARARSTLYSAETISVRFQILGRPLEPLPFKWGVIASDLASLPLNALLITVDQGSTSSSALNQQRALSYEPTVLYIRRGPLNGNNQPVDPAGVPIPETEWGAVNAVFRVSSQAETSFQFNRSTGSSNTEQLELDSDRPSQFAVALLNQLSLIRRDSWVVGAIIRNDNPTQAFAMTAIELVAFSQTQGQPWAVLDLLVLPPDLEIATGNLQSPLSSFSNKPKSVRVKATTYTASGSGPDQNSGNQLREQAIPTFIDIGNRHNGTNLYQRVQRISPRGYFS